jgi:hypothetical protein
MSNRIPASSISVKLLRAKLKETPVPASSLDDGPLRIGLPFRPDGHGTVHRESDVPSILAWNDLGVRVPALVVDGADGKRKLRDERTPQVTVVALPPRGPDDDDAATPVRDVTRVAEHLRGIDALQIPGGMLPGRTQRASGRGRAEDAATDASFFVSTKPRDVKERGERRAYEVALIDRGRTVGAPINAMCAGVWTLIESFNGVVETLPENERQHHHAKVFNVERLFELRHALDMAPGSMLAGAVAGKRHLQERLRIENANSTHWAVAALEPGTPLRLARLPADHPSQTRRAEHLDDDPHRAEDPNALLEVTGTAPGADGASPTVEVIESRRGAPIFASQTHFEADLPGCGGDEFADTQAIEAAQAFFRASVQSATTTHDRRNVHAELLHAFSLVREGEP